ncbi:NADH dehydrogenase [ubiquinone] 1 beta subcomplex subunit 7 [Erinaceus europaeus]|uniref:NADH dehydrogenase [ubiquinone] 1 beta subcomplex subunit 7 n=1 Tax=Erinaceus europaeus TaxID=9365 RepID=A0ABM3WPA5_ERIEU|nr:NADH dehydrogenase [ubiquinone] 1 beta subcomplex subunit 7 [Erinaceus europaeus]
MGAHLARRYFGDESVEPDPLRMPSFPPEYGFQGRREREMVATARQMSEAQLPLAQRDYCAHHLLRLLKCKRDAFPDILRCRPERHAWELCEHRDYVMRMKEFERERRLLRRRQRKEQREASAA